MICDHLFMSTDGFLLCLLLLTRLKNKIFEIFLYSRDSSVFQIFTSVTQAFVKVFINIKKLNYMFSSLVKGLKLILAFQIKILGQVNLTVLFFTYQSPFFIHTIPLLCYEVK